MDETPCRTNFKHLLGAPEPIDEVEDLLPSLGLSPARAVIVKSLLNDPEFISGGAPTTKPTPRPARRNLVCVETLSYISVL